MDDFLDISSKSSDDTIILPDSPKESNGHKYSNDSFRLSEVNFNDEHYQTYEDNHSGINSNVSELYKPKSKFDLKEFEDDSDGDFGIFDKETEDILKKYDAINAQKYDKYKDKYSSDESNNGHIDKSSLDRIRTDFVFDPNASVGKDLILDQNNDEEEPVKKKAKNKVNKNDKEALKIQKQLEKEAEKSQKEALKHEKQLERERKKQELEKEKALKKAVAQTNKNLKPEECLKFINVHIDNTIIEELGEKILVQLKENNIRHKNVNQIFPMTITWSREVQSHLLNDNGQLVLTNNPTETEEILLIMNWNQFLEYVDKNTMIEYVQNIMTTLSNKKISLAIFGLERYYRFLKNQKNQNFAASVKNTSSKNSTDSKLFKDAPKVSRRSVEYVLTELQILHSCSYRCVETCEELGQLIFQFTKSIANIPFKQEKQEKYQQAQWYMAGENKDCVRVDANGNGLKRLWHQILTMFPLARLETAEAISSVYPSPDSLMKAYQNCKTTKEGEQLLQDIPIRRAAGPLTSVRRIGPELSKKIFKFFTSIDGDLVL